MEKYTIGIDFGTQSGRGVLVQVSDGRVVAQAEASYAHGLLETQLPDGTPLPRGYVLQDPLDYLQVLEHIVPSLLEHSSVIPDDIIGISIDATACSFLPVDENWEPLCNDPRFRSEPHAYLKMWKHHPSLEAAHINRVIQDRHEEFIQDYGGICHAEWLFPKLLETLRNAPDVYHSAYRFIEVADWLTTRLCGQERRNSCAASYKTFWKKSCGFPTPAFFAAIDPRLENVTADKLGGQVHSIGSRAGSLTPTAAEKLGLHPGIAVGIAHVDAHVALPAVGITEPGQLLLIIGTSTCNMLLDHTYRQVSGICGVAEDGIIPGFYGYEAGQSAVGDLLNWIVKYVGSSSHTELTEKASRLHPGQSGLLMLDWLGGNRSILSNKDLTGLIVGLTLQTKPEEIYRAAIEATAFGQRIILENFRNHGMDIHTLFACGGITHKNPLFMQIYADVLRMPIRVCASDQTPAVGAAIFAAAAAGTESGGYPDVHTASRAMHHPYDRVYTPREDHALIYDKLYEQYKALYFLFGKDNTLMRSLQEIQWQSASSFQNG